MATGKSLGLQAIDEIASIWQVDPARSTRRENGFDWWPGDYRVSVTAFPRQDGQQPDSALLWVQTDFLTDLPIKDDKFVQIAAATSRFCTSTYAWAWDTGWTTKITKNGNRYEKTAYRKGEPLRLARRLTRLAHFDPRPRRQVASFND
jgi:hypothetical protein